MSDERPKPGTESTPAGSERSVALPVQPAGNEPPLETQRDPNKLTAEEQMAAFEKELQENDWGHQPC
jgi:hypothetical protein